VSKIDHANHKDWPEWMGTIDFTALKLKLLSSIVAISAIQLLKQFMEVKSATDRELFWYVVIHIVFVVSSVLLALSDRIAEGSHGHKAPPPSSADNNSATH
ncbi:MAG: YqhA family protein, partial [Hyphomicrobiaceae bacterium]